ncbi:MAG: hypothetical protein KC609_20875, partial [Myxococcales bacterium]|nr:hypothetical protein [Myxococcales bacterium]
MKWGWQILATLVALGCVAQLGCSDWFSGSHHHTVTTGGTSSSPTGTTSSNGTSGGSQGTSTINPSYTYGTTDSGPTGLCEHPGDGPELPFDGAYSGRFPLKPILALYDKADCRTFSPAFIRRLVTDLTGYLAGSVELTATPGDLTAATVELVGLPESTIRELLGFDSSETTSDGLRRVIALYVRSYDGGEGAKAWSQFLAGQTLGGYLEDALSQLVTGMRLAWGAPATASALGVSEAELAAASVSDDALYREVLGVTKTEALQLLDEHKLTSDDTLDEFLSLIHVSRPLDGKRFAYAFVVDGDLTPVRNLNRGDFQVRVDGDSIPTSDLTVHTLAELAKNDAQT